MDAICGCFPLRRRRVLAGTPSSAPQMCRKSAGRTAASAAVLIEPSVVLVQRVVGTKVGGFVQRVLRLVGGVAGSTPLLCWFEAGLASALTGPESGGGGVFLRCQTGAALTDGRACCGAPQHLLGSPDMHQRAARSAATRLQLCCRLLLNSLAGKAMRLQTCSMMKAC